MNQIGVGFSHLKLKLVNGRKAEARNPGTNPATNPGMSLSQITSGEKERNGFGFFKTKSNFIVFRIMGRKDG